MLMLKKGIKKSNKERKSKEIQKVDPKVNPFEIKKDMPLRNIGRTSSFHLLILIQMVKDLPVDKTTSIVIPKTVAETAKDASNLVLALRRFISKSDSFPNNFTVTLRAFKDAEGNYINSRIWRIN